MDLDLLDPHYGRLAGSRSLWRDTDLDPGHINVQNNAMANEFYVNKLVNVDFFLQVLKHFFLNSPFTQFCFISKHSTAQKNVNQL